MIDSIIDFIKNSDEYKNGDESFFSSEFTERLHKALKTLSDQKEENDSARLIFESIQKHVKRFGVLELQYYDGGITIDGSDGIFFEEGTRNISPLIRFDTPYHL